MSTAYEQFKSDHPSVAAQVDEISRALADRLWLPPRTSKLEDIGLSLFIANSTARSEGPPGGIFGAGVVSRSDGSVHPCVFTVPVLASGEENPGRVVDAPAEETPASRVLAYYGALLDAEVRVVGLPVPEPQNISLGRKIWSCGRTGTASVEVRTMQDTRGFLTAGHVVQDVGSQVSQDGRVIGVVASTSYLDMYGPDDVVADVGVVELVDTAQKDSERSHCRQTVCKTQNSVVVHTSAGPRAGYVRGLVESFALRQGKACWADVAITERSLSSAGDSGAPAYLGDEPDSFIGHVVAGDERAYTLIQDASRILRAANVELP